MSVLGCHLHLFINSGIFDHIGPEPLCRNRPLEAVPFSLLHSLHSVCKLVISNVPPPLSGTIWSTDKYRLVPQRRQVKSSFSQTSQRNSGGMYAFLFFIRVHYLPHALFTNIVYLADCVHCEVVLVVQFPDFFAPPSLRQAILFIFCYPLQPKTLKYSFHA